MAVLDYSIVFISGGEESLSLFNRWSSTQDCVNYLTRDEKSRDVYQVKVPMSLQVVIQQAQRCGCTVSLW